MRDYLSYLHTLLSKIDRSVKCCDTGLVWELFAPSHGLPIRCGGNLLLFCSRKILKNPHKSQHCLLRGLGSGEPQQFYFFQSVLLVSWFKNITSFRVVMH